ncbi:hypothetical protein [Hahella sp. CCB-MM4]|uniref:hypothetical protein n=1 Tax=Hahella sp. (strain CCB-MM4) TaxID=1926491 RepID=UPI00143CE133|nr:hypothetical protein [Hahella sp. CCB-MM4]
MNTIPKQESPIATISSLIGPLMANMMFRRANVSLPIPDIDPKAHVEGFLNGRRL